jgi:phospholipase C
VVHALMGARTWRHTALFLTYDEHGGYYDHVPPPSAIPPDSVAPLLTASDVPGAFNRYGFRVPMIVVSPWARRRYVSRVVHDHTSITAFIEGKWNLPAMTFRDATAHPIPTTSTSAGPPSWRRPSWPSHRSWARAREVPRFCLESAADGVTRTLTG